MDPKRITFDRIFINVSPRIQKSPRRRRWFSKHN